MTEPMTKEQRAELLDLYVDEALPEALREHVEAYLAAHPEAQNDVATLQQTVARLNTATAERPDTWFAERTLDRLLREHSAAEKAPHAPTLIKP